MKPVLGLLMTTFFAASSAFAADIFVRDTQGPDLTEDQITEVTELVERAVERMPEHSLVVSEDLSDFVLQPSVSQHDNQMVLRIEKIKEGEILASSEEVLPTTQVNSQRAYAATETALQNDDIASTPVDSTTSSSSSASTTSADDDALIESNSEANSHSVESNAMAESGVVSDTSTNSDATSTSEDNAMISTPDTPANLSPLSGDQTAMGAGDVRAPSPIFQRPDRMGAFQVGIGPAFGIGMDSDQLLYDVHLGYVAPVSDLFSIKGFGDLNLATGGDANRFLNFGVGADVFPIQSETIVGGRPYLMADVGYAFTRDKNSVTQDAPAVGAGGGFKFATEQLNMDVNLHYTMLTAKIRDDYPSVLGVRAALNF